MIKIWTKLIIAIIMVIAMGLVSQPLYNPNPPMKSSTMQYVAIDFIQVTAIPDFQSNDIDNKEVAKPALATVVIITALFIMLLL